MKRRLAAILAADVVGYSRLMAADEAGTLQRLTALREDILKPLIAGHNGRLVKLIGDGLLVEFPSLVDAIECSAAWQAAVLHHEAEQPEGQHLSFRIGINLGDVIVDGDDVYGDGVNTAARLEGLAEAGGICISGDAYRQVRGKVQMGFVDMGEQPVKNLPEAIRVYRVVPGEADARAAPQAQVVPLREKPSIAVLPFNNMSGDPEQEYFADGIVEEIITALSRIRWLFVIARNSSFTYKGRAVDVKQVGRELGVRYVLEGSVRKSGSRIRLTGQLIDTALGGHLWADHFDGELSDIFELQDQMTASVVAAIAPKLEQAEIERAKQKPTENLDAYDYYLRGLACVHRWTHEASNEALEHFAHAIELDPEFAAAYGMAARCYSQRKVSGWASDRARESAEAERLARLAAAFGKDDAVALCTAGMALAYVSGDLDGGTAMVDRALQLNPNVTWGELFSGWVRVWLGRPDEALEHLARAMQLSPSDPHLYNMQAGTAAAYFEAGRYEEALSWGEAAAREQPNHLIASCIVAASAAFLDRQATAQRAVALLRRVDPSLRVADLSYLIPLRRQEHHARLSEGLRKAGLPA